MKHSAENCQLCRLDKDARTFAGNLFLWMEPDSNIEEEFGLPFGSVQQHFAGVADGAFLRLRESSLAEWPRFENSGALFARISSNLYTRLKRLAARIETVSAGRDDEFIKIASTTARFLCGDSVAGDGRRWAFYYSVADATAHNYANSIDLSKMKSSEKVKLLGSAEQFLPKEDLGVSEKIRRYGNAAVTVGMISRSASLIDSGADFSELSVKRYQQGQAWKWIFFRLLMEWFYPMLSAAKPLHRDFYVLSLSDRIEKFGDPLRDDFSSEEKRALLKSLQRQLRSVLRSRPTHHKPIKSMKQLMKRSDGIRFDRPVLYEEICEEIPMALASLLKKQRLQFKTASELIEALEAGKMGLAWNEAHDRLIDAYRKRLVLVESSEVSEGSEQRTGIDDMRPEQNLKSTESADNIVQQKVLEKLVARALGASKDELDRLIAFRILQYRIFGGKKPKNSQIASDWEAESGHTITGQAIGLRRNRIELEISAIFIHQSPRKAAHL